ncbi:MAG: hypothetical protein RL748_1513 [Pseudomonadota bacterium]|jgi:ribonuclease T2
MKKLPVALITALPLFATMAHASEPASGSFSASKTCDAFVSFKNATNPGNAQVRAGESFSVLEVNKKDYNWIRINLPAAKPQTRWVAADCGSIKPLPGGATPASSVRASAPAHEKRNPNDNICNKPDQFDSYVLALTWQPGFCEYKERSIRKPECAAMAKGALVVSNLSLHGLWPNKTACGINYGNCGNQRMNLSPETIKLVQPWMPNFFFSQSFGEYEWKKHGTCQTDMDGNAYFRKAVQAVQTVDSSEAGKFINANIGKKISLNQLKKLIQSAHPDAADSFSFLCAQDRLYEIRIKLPAQFKAGPGLPDLLGSTPLKASDRDRDVCRQDMVVIERSGVN